MDASSISHSLGINSYLLFINRYVYYYQRYTDEFVATWKPSTLLEGCDNLWSLQEAVGWLGVENLEKAARISFGLFEVKLQSGEIWRSGHRVRLQDQPFRVLATLPSTTVVTK
jgi:hypothetical protein